MDCTNDETVVLVVLILENEEEEDIAWLVGMLVVPTVPVPFLFG